mmetsp:Transcript_41433/g.97300  ORF Transcript_41433/g.97300 Transcript_41433/m.97300 type:complete len:315 (+) Transcript_41433:94-1038(+)
MAPKTTLAASTLAAGGLVAMAHYGSEAFVVQQQVPKTSPQLLRSSGGVAQTEPRTAGGFSSASATAAAVASIGAGMAVGAASRKKTKTAMLAEPVSAAAAAAAAKAAAGAAAGKAAAGAAAGTKAAAAGTAAVKTSGAVGAGAGTAGSLKKEDDAPANKAFDPSTQLGAMEPLGFFDPAGFTAKGDEAGFRNLRAAEIKHGRVAMMAAVGAVVQHYVQFPGFTDVPTGLAAAVSPPGAYGFAALFLAAGALELGAWTESPEKEPGNFGDPAGLNMYTEEMRLKELNNGRFAMFAAIGIIAAELYTGKDAIEQFM